MLDSSAGHQRKGTLYGGHVTAKLGLRCAKKGVTMATHRRRRHNVADSKAAWLPTYEIMEKMCGVVESRDA
eukprot:1160660-Pelagomonas_calceolata.AAC.4